MHLGSCFNYTLVVHLICSYCVSYCRAFTNYIFPGCSYTYNIPSQVSLNAFQKQELWKAVKTLLLLYFIMEFDVSSFILSVPAMNALVFSDPFAVINLPSLQMLQNIRPFSYTSQGLPTFHSCLKALMTIFF